MEPYPTSAEFSSIPWILSARLSSRYKRPRFLSVHRIQSWTFCRQSHSGFYERLLRTRSFCTVTWTSHMYRTPEAGLYIHESIASDWTWNIRQRCRFCCHKLQLNDIGGLGRPLSLCNVAFPKRLSLRWLWQVWSPCKRQSWGRRSGTYYNRRSLGSSIRVVLAPRAFPEEFWPPSWSSPFSTSSEYSFAVHVPACQRACCVVYLLPGLP